MAKINVEPQWAEEINLIARGEKVEGGRDGGINIQAKQLADRTSYLKRELATLKSEDEATVKASLDFSTGGTLKSVRDEIIYGNLRLVWTGDFPKVVLFGSTPAATGGIGPGAWAYTSDAAVRQDMASRQGLAMLGAPLGGTLFDLLRNAVTPDMFGAIPGGIEHAHNNSLAFQNMLDEVRDNGGGTVLIDDEYWTDYIIFAHRGTTIIGTSRGEYVNVDPVSKYGRGGIVVGTSHEFNYQKARENLDAGTWPASVRNDDFVNPSRKQYLRDNQHLVASENVVIYGLKIRAYYTDPSQWGGYAINCLNAQNVLIENVSVDGWTEGVNAGSDVPPETPSCHNIIIRNLTVVNPDKKRTYYAGFFIANSTDCHVDGVRLLSPVTDGTLNGSLGATNFVEDCTFRGIFTKSLGRSMTSEGFLLNNAKGCRVEPVNIGNAKTAMATFYTDTSYNDPAKPNFIDYVEANNCDQAIAIAGKYAMFAGVRAYNCSNEVLFRNINATANTIKKRPASFATTEGGANLLYWYLINNTVDGWKRKLSWIRPLEILASPFTSLTTWNENNTVKMAKGTVTFLYKVPETMKAIAGFTVYGDFSEGAKLYADAPGGTDTTCTVDLIAMSAADGNGAPAVPLITATVSAKSRGDGQWVMSADAQTKTPGYIANEGVTGSVDNALYLRVRFVNSVANNTLKLIGLRYYGD